MLLLRTLTAFSIANAFVGGIVLALSTVEFGWRRPDDVFVINRSQFSRSRSLVYFSFISSSFAICAAAVCVFCNCFDLSRHHRKIVANLCITLSFIALTTQCLSAAFGISVLAHHDFQYFDELLITALLDIVGVFLQSITILLLFQKTEVPEFERVTTRRVY